MNSWYLYYRDPVYFGPLLFHINLIAKCLFSLVLQEVNLYHTFANFKLISKFERVRVWFTSWNLRASVILFSCPVPISSTSIAVNYFPSVCRELDPPKCNYSDPQMLSETKNPPVILTPLEASWVINRSCKEKLIFNIATLISGFATDTTQWEVRYPFLLDVHAFCILLSETFWKGDGKHFQSRVAFSPFAFSLSSGAKALCWSY